MNINPNQFVQMFKGQGNPQQMMMTMLENQMAQQNPIFSNLLQMAKSNDNRGIEQVARNMLKERGLDFDKEFANFKKMYNL